MLEAFWLLGFLPDKEVPHQGMRILALTEYLSQGNFKDEESLEKGQWLYEQIIKDELIGRPVS